MDEFVYKFIDPQLPEDYALLLARALWLEKQLGVTKQELERLRREYFLLWNERT